MNKYITAHISILKRNNVTQGLVLPYTNVPKAFSLLHPLFMKEYKELKRNTGIMKALTHI